MFLDGRTKALHDFRRSTFQRLSHNATVFVFLAFLVISTDMSFIIRHRMPPRICHIYANHIYQKKCSNTVISSSAVTC